MTCIADGIITVRISLIAFLTLTDPPATARWFTEEEKELAVARVKAERVGTTRVSDGMDEKKPWQGTTNPVSASTSMVFMLNNVTNMGGLVSTWSFVPKDAPHCPIGNGLNHRRHSWRAHRLDGNAVLDEGRQQEA